MSQYMLAKVVKKQEKFKVSSPTRCVVSESFKPYADMDEEGRKERDEMLLGKQVLYGKTEKSL